MMKFEYPIPVSGEDATELLGHKNAVGHYPMGRLFNWHGGLHVFEREYAPIKAIADGVVIAYRVGKTAIECEGVKFSNRDRKSTRLNSSHVRISYAVFCL